MSEKKPELLYITNPGCGWCKKADPVVEQMRKDVDLAKAQANIDMKAGEARGALEQIIFNKVLDWAF